MKYFKPTTLGLLLAGIGLAAFRLSYDAQVTLAVASGVALGLAGLYPIIVDAAIFTGVLIRLWHPELGRGLAGYLWAAIAFWTITSVLGNAFHVLALPPDRIQLPAWIAIAVNTLPALTLFLVIHLATTTAFRAKPAPAPTSPRARRTTSQATLSTSAAAIAQPRTPRTDIPPVNAQELLAMEDAGMSLKQIADEVGRSKSYIGRVVKQARDEREQATA
jgi:hypothetical protein